MVDPQLLSDQRQASRWWQVLGPSFPYRQFVFGAVAPITIFYIFHNFGQPLTGALLAVGWGICLLAITLLALPSHRTFSHSGDSNRPDRTDRYIDYQKPGFLSGINCY